MMNPDFDTAAPLPRDVWLSFLHAIGPRRVRLISVHALLTLACGREADMQHYGEAVHKWLKKHWSTHLTRLSPGVWRLQKEHDLLPFVGLAGQPEMARKMRRLIGLAMERGLEAQHLAALVYGLKEGGVTRSELHQHPWTAKRHRGETTSTRYGYMRYLESIGLVRSEPRPSTSRYPFTVWHTTPKGRDLILGLWMKPTPAVAAAAPVLKTARAYSNLNAA